MATIAERLRDAPKGCDDYVDYLSESLAAADSDDIDDGTFSEAFHFIERNAHADLGSPGPLVHFIERHYPRYCRHLVESVERHPTTHTLWMLNRILNGRPSDEERAELLKLLAAIAGSEGADPELRQQSRRFWERHAPAS